jgi:PBP1b-binding outer membrane lipoprotein LpoB
MKRYIRIITMIALFLGCVSFAFAASPSFNDVPAKTLGI